MLCAQCVIHMTCTVHHCIIDKRATDSLSIEAKVDWIFVNAMQVGAIIVLAHPRVQAAVEQGAENSQSSENE